MLFNVAVIKLGDIFTVVNTDILAVYGQMFLYLLSSYVKYEKCFCVFKILYSKTVIPNQKVSLLIFQT